MFYIKPKREYCRKHGIEYSGYMCPECRMEMERESHSQSGTRPEVKHNAKVPKSKKKEIHIENFPISDEVLEKTNQLGSKKPTQIPNWLFALLLIFSLSILGLGLNALTKSPIPLWLLLGFSIIYPIERWFRKATLNKPTGKLYRLILNLALLSTLGLLIWSGFQLVEKQLASTPLTSSVVFVAELVFFVWMWRKVAKNSWRWPSMKLTIFVLVCIVIIFTFAGVPPLSTYKENLVVDWEKYQTEQAVQKAEKEAEEVAQQQAEQEREESARLEDERLEEQRLETERLEAGRLEEQRLEAERLREAEEAGILYGGMPLGNPTWAELITFLASEDTDEQLYIYPSFVCADFANRLQKNAKEAGWRCAVVFLNMSGYLDPYKYGIAPDAGHACNAFETTDRGLVYIDCTRPGMGFTGSADTVVDIQIGKEYISKLLFPTSDWLPYFEGMGVVEGIEYIRW